MKGFVTSFAIVIWSLLGEASASERFDNFVAESAWETFLQDVATTYSVPEMSEFVLPMVMWHNRLAYDENYLRRFNEDPHGIGIAQSRFDEGGNWRSLYAISIQDSYNKFEPFVGYAWEKIWRPAGRNFRLGLGLTAAITARHNWNYMPAPIVLPLASIGFGPVTMQATYIPGARNEGNVLVAWLRFSVKK